MSYLYRGVSQAMDTLCGGKLRPKGNSAKVAMKIGDPSLRIDGTWDIGASEENAVRAHQFESGRHGGCLVSTTRNEKMAQLFATTGNTEDGYVYVIDESLLPAYGVLAFERKYQENSHEEEVSLRAEDCGDLPEEIIVAKYEVHAST